MSIDESIYPLQLWGKKGTDGNVHLLEYHLLDSAAVCRQLLIKDGRVRSKISSLLGIADSQVLHLLPFLCSIHDIGKVSERFQKGDYESMRWRHDLIGCKYLQKYGSDVIAAIYDGNLDGMNRRSKIAVRGLINATMMHHGSPVGVEQSQDLIDLELPSEGERVSADTIVHRMINLFLSEGPILTDDDLGSKTFKTATMIISGLVSLSDWISSDGGLFERRSDSIDVRDYYSHSENLAEGIFDSDVLGISRKQPSTASFESIFNYSASPMQSMMKEVAGGSRMIIIEDATGSGKTEASLFWAIQSLIDSDVSGITIALPTKATTNMMFSRLEAYGHSLFEEQSTLSLSHGSAKQYLESDETSDVKGWYSENNTKALFANMSVCTVDQILKSVIPSRYASLRVLAIERHVIIIDEVHSYDAYTFGLICEFVRMCRILDTPVVLMSATLPLSMRKRLVQEYGGESSSVESSDYPLVTICSSDSIKEVHVEPSSRSIRTIRVRYTSDEKKMIDEMIDLARFGYNVCWIRNTVEDAISSYTDIGGMGVDTLLLHSRFTLSDRQDLEKEVISRCGKQSKIGMGLLVISTQILEQSLDISFDRVFSDLSPMDSIIQRMGRDQRFAENRIPCEFVINGPPIVRDPSHEWYGDYFSKAQYVYRNHYSLWRTAVRLNNVVVSIPHDYRGLIEDAYSSPEPDSPFYSDYISFMNEVMCSTSKSRERMLKVDEGYGFSTNQSLWNQDDLVGTREDKDRTMQCVLVTLDGGRMVPISGDVESSCITLKKTVYVERANSNPFGRRWSYHTIVIMNDEGGFLRSGNMTYTREKGAEYVQSD